MKTELNIAVIGAGGFANFAAKAFLKMPDVRIIAFIEINEDAAIQMSNDFEAKVYKNLDDFLEDKIIDLIYIKIVKIIGI